MWLLQRQYIFDVLKLIYSKSWLWDKTAEINSEYAIVVLDLVFTPIFPPVCYEFSHTRKPVYQGKSGDLEDEKWTEVPVVVVLFLWSLILILVLLIVFLF